MKRRHILLALLVLVLAAAMLLGGCTYQSDRADRDWDEGEEEEEREERRDPEDALEICEEFFDAYTELDAEATGRLLTGMGDPFSFGTLTGILAESAAVELGEPELEDDTCTIPVTIETIDLQAVFAELPDTIASKEEATQWLSEAMGAKDAPRKTFETEALLVLEEDGWKVELTGGLSDALMGGYFTMLSEMTGEAKE